MHMLLGEVGDQPGELFHVGGCLVEHLFHRSDVDGGGAVMMMMGTV